MIRLTLTSLDDAAAYVRPEAILYFFTDLGSINHYTRVVLSNGGYLLVKETPEEIARLIDRPQKDSSFPVPQKISSGCPETQKDFQVGKL